LCTYECADSLPVCLSKSLVFVFVFLCLSLSLSLSHSLTHSHTHTHTLSLLLSLSLFLVLVSVSGSVCLAVSGSGSLGTISLSITQEEHRIIKAEIVALKALRSSPNQPKKPKEVLVRLIYCEMLGHDASFGYIQAVNMTQQPQLINKRVGYLACSLFLNPDHELMVLLVNSFLRDLASVNYLEVCSALNAMSR
jgi:Adaptin N terminal region